MLHVCTHPATTAVSASASRLLPAALPAPLALSDGLHISLAVFQLAFSAVVSVALWRLTAWQRRYEGLEQRLHETTARLVEERFRAMTHEVNSHVQGLVLTLDDMKGRLQHGDGELRSLSERDQKIELALAGRIDVLKDWIREHAAGRGDLEKHEAAFERKLGTVEQRLSDLTSNVAVLSERVREV